jgi:glycolate oxidase FAD binding subunit
LQARVSSSGATLVDVVFEGTAAGVDAQVRDAQRLAKEIRLDDGAWDVWEARQALWTNENAPILKVSVLPADLAGTLQQIRRLAEAARVEWAAVFQATGVGWVSIIGRPANWPELVRELRAAIEAQSGSVTILRPASADDASDAWGETGDAHQALMAAVKREFDPKRTLNPGRFVGGI